jgi:hypothetical protein
LIVSQTDEVSVCGVNLDKLKMNADVLCNNWDTGKNIAENTI